MKKNKYIFLFASIIASQFFVSCNEDSIDKVNSAIPYEAIGGYNSSDEIAPSNLIAKVSFDGNVNDAKNGLTGGSGTNVTYTTGIKGQAYKGSTSTFISYASAATVANVKSVTFSMWIKTEPHTGGAQSLFMLPKTTDFWGNIFSLIEGTGPETTMLLKNHLEKDVTPSIPWSGQWIVHDGANVLPNMFGTWKHLVWTYSASSSTYSLYVNGKKIDLPVGMSKRYTKSPDEGGIGYGDLANSDSSKFIIGGYQQHLGTPWGAPDGWMLNYTGLMDEFRIYNSALTDNEVISLYKLEKDNR
jgi:hypothetical protein